MAGAGAAAAERTGCTPTGSTTTTVTDLIAISVRSASEIWFIDHSTTTAEARTGEGRPARSRRRSAPSIRAARVLGSGRWAGLVQPARPAVPCRGGRHRALRVQQRQRPAGTATAPARTCSRSPSPRMAGSGMALPAQPELAWTWDGGDEPIFNGHISGVQRLESGNTLVCLGEEGRVLEVTPDHVVVWEYLQDFKPDEGSERGGPAGRSGPPQGRPDRGGPPGGGPPGGSPGVSPGVSPGGRPRRWAAEFPRDLPGQPLRRGRPGSRPPGHRRRARPSADGSRRGTSAVQVAEEPTP